jgi:hypothetical protein
VVVTAVVVVVTEADRVARRPDRVVAGHGRVQRKVICLAQA